MADLGIGIGGSVNRFLRNQGHEELDDLEAIKWALEKNRSSLTQPHNRGFGLDNLKTFISSGDHKWYLFSGMGALTAKDGKVKFHRNTLQDHFGTLSQINIEIDQLPNKEEAHETIEYFG